MKPSPAILILRETLAMIIQVMRKQIRFIDEHHIDKAGLGWKANKTEKDLVENYGKPRKR